MSLLRWSPLVLVCLGAVDLVLLRGGRIDHPAWVIAAIAGAALVATLANVARLAWAARGPAARGRRLAGALALSGLATVLAGGVANWLFFVQGFVVLQELDAVPLQLTSHLDGFSAGPLASLDDLHLDLQLEKVELLPSLAGWTARSRLRIRRAGGEVEQAELEAGRAVAAGPLLLHHGAFGFAPHVVVIRGPETLVDRVVPLLVLKDGADGAMRYEGAVPLPGERPPALRAWVDLASLDSGGRGHARLGFELRDGDRLVGAGTLRPGFFANFGDGEHWQVGFVGLRKWAEIDVSRRTYGGVMRAGAAVALAGVLLLGLAAWRRW